MKAIFTLCVVLAWIFALDFRDSNLTFKNLDSPESIAENIESYAISEKFDGVRGIWDGKEMFSKNGKKLAIPPCFAEKLAILELKDGEFVEGELWADDGKFAEVSSLARRKNPTCAEFESVKYLIFNAQFNESSDFLANLSKIQSANIENIGKIPCQKPIIIRKRIDLIPHSIYAAIENNGRLAYYNQHTYIPAIPYLPMAKITLQALNHQNKPLRNFTKDCYGRDLSAKLDDNISNFVFINENMPDSLIPKASFLDNSLSRVVRKISATGIKDRDLTPLDLFSSRVVNLNDAFLTLDFVNLGAKYPRYITKPKITNDWRIALLRGRIALLPNSNANESLIANPKINYEFYCKYPACKIVDIESVLSRNARLPKASVNDWFINTMHPSDLKVLENHLAFEENAKISVYSIGSVANGVQTLALQSANKGEFSVKIRQSY